MDVKTNFVHLGNKGYKNNNMYKSNKSITIVAKIIIGISLVGSVLLIAGFTVLGFKIISNPEIAGEFFGRIVKGFNDIVK